MVAEVAAAAAEESAPGSREVQNPPTTRPNPVEDLPVSHVTA